jgi:hypothetical protein
MIRIDNQYPIVAEVQRNHGKKTYQAQALKLIPWICARGGHELAAKGCASSLTSVDKACMAILRSADNN